MNSIPSPATVWSVYNVLLCGLGTVEAEDDGEETEEETEEEEDHPSRQYNLREHKPRTNLYEAPAIGIFAFMYFEYHA